MTKTDLKNKSLTQYITLIGLFAAISTVLDAFLTVPLFSSWMKVTFGYIPEALAAVLLGPGAAILTATISDIFSTLLRGEQFSFLFVWLAVAQGAITGIILNRKLTLKRIVINRLLVNIIVNLFLNTLLLDYMGYTSWRIRLPLQLIKCPITGASEIIILSIILPAVVNSIRRFGFFDVHIQDNIQIESFTDLRRRFGLPVLEAAMSLLAICPLMIPCIDLTYQGTEVLSFFGFFAGKLFDGNLVLDYKILAVMLIPILLTTACFLLSFSQKHAVKITLGLLDAFSLIAVFQLVLVPYLSKIENLSTDYSGMGIIFAAYAILALVYSILSLLQREIQKSKA